MSRAFRSAGSSADRLARDLDGINKSSSDLGAGVGGILKAAAALVAIPSVGPAAAGVAALAPSFLAAAAGATGLAAVAVPAMNRIKAAIAAQSAAQDDAGASAAQGQARALAQAGAQQALAAAIRNAAYAHAQALDQVRSAEDSLADAQKDAKQAQQDLNASRLEAKQQAEDMANRIVDGQLSVRQSTFDVADAQAAYNKLMADPKATEGQRQRAQLAIDQARQNLKEQRDSLKQLEAQQKHAAKVGVEGSDVVKDARDRLAEANKKVTDSEKELADARANVARVDQQSAEAVTSARRALTAASLQGASASSALDKAMAKLSPSARTLMGQWQGLTGAFDTWQRSMEPKVLPLLGRGIAILKGQLPALTPIVTNAANAVGGLLTRIAKGAKSSEFVAFRTQLTKLVPTALSGFGNAALDVARGLMGIVSAFMPSAPGMLAAVNQLAAKFGAWGAGLSGSAGFKDFMVWVHGFADVLVKNGPAMSATLGDLAAALIHVGTSLTPVAGNLALGAVSGLSLLAKAISGLSPGQIQALAYAFVGYRTALVAVTVASTAFSAGGALAGGLSKVAQAARDAGAAIASSGLVQGFRNVNLAFADGASRATILGAAIRSQLQLWWQQASAATAAARAQVGAALAATRARIATVASAVAAKAAAAASKVWAAGVWLVNGAMAGNPIALVIIAVVALVAAIVVAYKSSATFRAVVQAAWSGIRSAAAAAWAFLKPIFAAIANVLTVVLKIAFIVLWNTIKIAWIAIQIIVKLGWIVIKAIFAGIKYYIVNVLAPIFRWLYNNVIKPVWNWIKTAIMVNWVVIKAVFLAIKAHLSGPLSAAFRVFKSVVGVLWTGLKTAMTSVWNNGIKPVFSGIRTALSAVKDAFGWAVNGIKSIWGKLKDVARVPVNFVIGLYNNGLVKLVNGIASVAGVKTRLDKIPTFARGGVMPGYAPGRDTLMAAVSPGESIFRPEFTKGVGSGWVGMANDIARKQGPAGVRRWLGAGGAPLGSEGGAFARGGTVPGYAGQFGLGGIVSGFVKGAKDWTLGNVKKAANGVLNKILNVNVPGSGIFHDAISAVPKWIKENVLGWLGDNAGGAGGPGMQKALSFAKAQSGKPYLWGGVGPSGYDCSGFMSALTNVIQGRSPYSRMFSTHSFDGTSGPGGFKRGQRSGFEVGVTNAGVGHMAGTLLGVNVESNGSQGVHYGPGARGANNTLFGAQYGLKADTGALTLQPGWNPPTFNGTGKPELLMTARPQSGGIVFHNSGIIGSQAETERWLQVSLERLRRKGKLPAGG
ncbi:MAG: hypothetical protein ABIS86_17045 [Streptosporangiaceae bacterium]